MNYNYELYRERLKLETSNLAQRLKAVSINEKNANLGQRCHVGVTWPTFGILGPHQYELTCKGHSTKKAQDLVT